MRIKPKSVVVEGMFGNKMRVTKDELQEIIREAKRDINDTRDSVKKQILRELVGKYTARLNRMK